MIREKEEGGEKYLTVETEDDFHEALEARPSHRGDL